MAKTIRLRVEVENNGIIVALAGTTFHVIYRKAPDAPGLVVFALQTTKLPVSLKKTFSPAHGA